MFIPMIRPGIGVYRNKNKIEFEIYNEHKQISYTADELAINIISYLTGEFTDSEILHMVNQKLSSKKINKHFLKDFCNQLFCDGLIVYKSLKNNYELLDRENNYLNMYPNKNKFTDEFLKKLMNKHITVIGCGGLGSNLLEQLFRIGVQNYTIVDFDKVEPENLANQAIFTSKDINKSKVDVIKKFGKTVNPAININNISLKVDQTNINQVIAGTDFVFSCADYPSIKNVSLLVSNECLKKGVPHIVGGDYSGHEASLGTMVIPKKTFTWKDYLETSKLGRNKNQEIIPPVVNMSFLPIIKIIAAIQINEFFKLFNNNDNLLLINSFNEFDMNLYQIRKTMIRKESTE